MDLIHIPYFAPLYKRTFPLVMTIHDASPLRFTWKNMGKNGVYDKLYRELCFPLLKKADIIIVVSHFLKDELLELTNIPENKIKPIQIDADWYDSVKIVLDNFYKKVVPGGFIVIDDYGFWEGCKKAVDEFLEKHKDEGLVLKRVDKTAVYFQKPIPKDLKYNRRL